MAALSISRAWDETRGALRSDGTLLTAVALAMFVLPGVVADLVTPAAPAGQMAPMGYWTVIGFVAVLISLIGQLAVVRLALGPRITVGEAIAHGARRAPAYVGAALIWIFPMLLVLALLIAPYQGNPQSAPPAVLLGVLVFVALFLFVAVRLVIASSVASAEPIGPIAILKRSWRLTNGHWWKLFGTLLVFLVMLLIVMAALGAVLGSVVVLLLGEAEPLSVSALLLALITQIVSAVLTTVLLVLLARIYAQLADAPRAEVSVPEVHQG